MQYCVAEYKKKPLVYIGNTPAPFFHLLSVALKNILQVILSMTW